VGGGGGGICEDDDGAPVVRGGAAVRMMTRPPGSFSPFTKGEESAAVSERGGRNGTHEVELSSEDQRTKTTSAFRAR
jgi:hypothetical protein